MDVVLDMVAGDYMARNLECLATEGRLVIIAVQHGPKIERFNVLPIMLKRLTVTGSTLRPRTVGEKAAIARALEVKVWPLLEAGRVKPIVHSRFALADAAGAHRLMEGSGHVGKIVLET